MLTLIHSLYELNLCQDLKLISFTWPMSGVCILNSLRVADLCQYLTPYNVSSSQIYGDGTPSILFEPDQIPSFVNIECSLTIIESPCRSLALLYSHMPCFPLEFAVSEVYLLLLPADLITLEEHDSRATAMSGSVLADS